MDGLSPTSIVGAPYNSLQVGTVISFAITYFFATTFLALRYVQTIKITKKVEVDLGKSVGRGFGFQLLSIAYVLAVILTIAYGLALFYFITLVQCKLCRVRLWVEPSDAMIVMRVGWGRHLNELSLGDLQEFNQILLPNTLTYLITPAVTKVAMLYVLYRISPSISYRCIIVAIGVSMFAYTLTLTSITGGPCNPLKAGTTKCLENVALSQAVLNIASDFAVILTPIPTIHALQLSFKQRVSVGAILAVGSAYAYYPMSLL
jgi:hypothetical protein